ncbi:MAG: transcription factor TFIIIC subunit tfc4 [Cirrosporium novae-zelandiae]|nr:MAG: transcription factor TFIIIC subunit tfc4 [Cirrosporium novae-zelandiae]
MADPDSQSYPDIDFVPSYPWLGPQASRSSVTNPDYTASEYHALDIDQTVPGYELDNIPDDGEMRSQSSDLDFISEDRDTSSESMSDVDFDSETDAFELPRNQRTRFKKSKAGQEEEVWHGGRGGKGIKRGPRKPVEPSHEFKALHSQATSAFIDKDYKKAIELVQQAIQVNPEIFAAYSLLSEIRLAEGDRNSALMALFSGAHTKPRDPKVWKQVADLILEQPGEDRQLAMKDAIYCYNRIISVERSSIWPRFQRAALHRELGRNGKAIYDYEHILSLKPHDSQALYELSETCIQANDVGKAINFYEETVAYHMKRKSTQATSFNWSEANIYVELYSYLGRYQEGILVLKSLARWILGRGQDNQWDQVTEDDREWDIEDEPRRIAFDWFDADAYDPESYGLSLPLELRIKLGIYRLKLGQQCFNEAIVSDWEGENEQITNDAQMHLEFLEPDDDQEGAKLFDYPDLFYEAADALQAEKLYTEAIHFYEPLIKILEYAEDKALFTSMAKCYGELGLKKEAEDCYHTVIDLDPKNIEARVQIAKILEDTGKAEQAAKYIEEVISLGKEEEEARSKDESDSAVVSRETQGNTSFASLAPKPKKPRPAKAPIRPRPLQTLRPIAPKGGLRPLLPNGPVPQRLVPREKIDPVHSMEADVKNIYQEHERLKDRIHNGDEASIGEWMKCAETLLIDFKSTRAFYPTERAKFVGYSNVGAHRRALKGGTLKEIEAMASRLHVSIAPTDEAPFTIPNTYKGVPFEKWLDIFLEYALRLTNDGKVDAAYKIISEAIDANIFFFNPSAMFLIHVCWFTCALAANDEETLCTVARWFMSKYQFTTDTYRLYSALNFLVDAPFSWYNAGPSQKYILRQVKAMDEALTKESSSKNSAAPPISDMDIALVMLYGQVLYVATSYSYALHYFYRAYAVDPKNPLILLLIALSYIQYALKRQSENRHYLVMQGFYFLFQYYDNRKKNGISIESQEAEYNVARAYHMLGLTHLAVPYYERVLAMYSDLQSSREEESSNDMAREAALALQSVFAGSGNVVAAGRLTKTYLII